MQHGDPQKSQRDDRKIKSSLRDLYEIIVDTSIIISSLRDFPIFRTPALFFTIKFSYEERGEVVCGEHKQWWK
jgi:hypothetical protein